MFTKYNILQCTGKITTNLIKLVSFKLVIIYIIVLYKVKLLILFQCIKL